MRCSVDEDTASVTVCSKLSYQYIDYHLPTYEEITFQVELFSVNGRWLIADMTEPYSWFDSVYKNNTSFEIDAVIDEFDTIYAIQCQNSLSTAPSDIESASLATINGYLYNKSNATAYAYTYTTSVESNTTSDFYNDNFYDWSSEGGDCINFVSQCIWAGFGGNNHTSAIDAHSFPMDDQGNYKWYSSSTRNYSGSWISNSAFRTYAEGSNSAATEVGLRTNKYTIGSSQDFSSITNYSNALLGSLLQVYGDSNYSHAIIVTDVEGASRSQVYYCAHTDMAKWKKLSDNFGSCPIYVYEPTMFYTGTTPSTPNVTVTMYRPFADGSQKTLTATTSTTCYKIVTTVYSPGYLATSDTVYNTNTHNMNYTFADIGLYSVCVTIWETSTSSPYYYYYTIRTY